MALRETRLEMAKRHVRESRRIIQQQRRLIEKQRRANVNTVRSEILLGTFQRTLARFEDDLAAVIAKRPKALKTVLKLVAR
jgi:hypothetical protein